MKLLILLAVLVGQQLAGAEDMTLLDGTVLRNVTIISADPERVLLVHDGGGMQVEYGRLKRITPSQRVEIESLLTKYAERQEDREALRLQREQFEQAQLEKGLVQFEGNWITPAERQRILTLREVARLERQRMKIELAQEKVELKQAELKARQGDELLEGPGESIIFNTGRTWPSYGGHGRVYSRWANGYWFPSYSYGLR